MPALDKQDSALSVEYKGSYAEDRANRVASAIGRQRLDWQRRSGSRWKIGDAHERLMPILLLQGVQNFFGMPFHLHL